MRRPPKNLRPSRAGWGENAETWDDKPGYGPQQASSPTVTEYDRQETGRILGPHGEVLAVCYDRAVIPFGFCKAD